MTTPIMPERARQIITRIAEKHGQTFEELTSTSRKLEARPARREAYSRLLALYRSETIGAWMKRYPNNILKNAKAYRDFVGLPTRMRGATSRPKPPVVTAFSLWRGPVPIPALRRSREEICAEIATFYGLTTDELRGPDRTQRTNHPRQHAMYVMSQQPHLTFGLIGQYLGGRDHTTVRHGVLAHAARLAAEWSGREAA